MEGISLASRPGLGFGSRRAFAGRRPGIGEFVEHFRMDCHRIAIGASRRSRRDGDPGARHSVAPHADATRN